LESFQPLSRTALLITTLVAVLTVLLWGLLNRPHTEPEWPHRIQGFSFSPMGKQHDPGKGRLPAIEDIDADLALLSGDAHAVRTYTVQGAMAEIPRLARVHDLNVALGAWLDGSSERNEQEIQDVIRLALENPRAVVRVFVGNEVLLHDLLPYDQLVARIQRVRDALDAPVSTAEPWHVWLKHPELVEQVDFIGVHLLPYWEGLPVDKAVEYAASRYRQLEEAYPGKPIVIAEVGWPSNGRRMKGAEATPANQASFLRQFLHLAEENDWTYYVMEAFDQPWKVAIEGAAGSYWGVYDTNREAKFPFTQPVVSVPRWRELAAVSVVAAIIVLVLLFRDSSGLSSWGRGFLAVVTYAAATATVFLVYDYTQQYLDTGTVVVGVLMLVAIIGLLLVLLAEAHEWAESLWLKEWRRPFSPPSVADSELPFVSIHVPAYNEPPDMLIETLDALAELDYPHFEVLVIDNNTDDPGVWEPVKARCAELGSRFRFFHVAPLSGFKAGALNFALRETAAEAEVVAVIDSDYIVSPRWLKDLVPAFAEPDMAIVQAPQDYRDGAENAFKAMCMTEYRGFFHLGMVTRNERNAIIQHGTMTMIKRSVLGDVGGWSEWCITEDAELGLRVFEQGYEATYVPRTYGRGLIPDSFLDFKKQRFRWAYGSVMILRRHFRALFGLESSRLSRGQRYHFIAGWLPWLADGFNLVFNLGAVMWSLGMVLLPERVAPPLILFAVFPLALFAFKFLKLVFLYRTRVRATIRQSLAAAIAGLSLSHTIARAILTGFVNSGIGFFRTPKMANAPALLRAASDAREELLLLLGLWVAAWGVLEVQGRDMLDIKVWALMLVVQSIPYAASGMMSLISALPRLPARLVGIMGELQEELPTPRPAGK
jgi:exo-beta-1,3-glucanase (GH17 family)/cellulose synthase/poly-beta-1,6-N-acetylglucosamine synthase-like glycosyltransferase